MGTRKTLTDLFAMESGVVLQKGNRKRIFLGYDSYFIYYRTPSSRGRKTGEHFARFLTWYEKAEVVGEECVARVSMVMTDNKYVRRQVTAYSEAELKGMIAEVVEEYKPLSHSVHILKGGIYDV